MGRSILIPERVFDAAHLATAYAQSSTGTARDYGRECRPAVRQFTRDGGLDPIGLGAPEADVDVEIALRTPGDVDGARWTWRNYGTGTYRGKQQCSVLSDVRLLASTASAASRQSRPKLLPLASGELIAFWVSGDQSSGWNGDAVNYRAWDATSGWGTAYNIANLPTAGAATYPVVAIDAVQLADTGEVVVMVLQSIAGQVPILTRMVGSYSSGYVSGPLSTAFKPSTCTFQRQSFTSIRGMAMEVLGNGRIAMLLHDQNGGLWRSYSDDRGVTWAVWVLVTNSLANAPGGVSMCRARTGSLVAISPSLTLPVANWTSGSNPRIRLFVSDDGDSWVQAVQASTANNDGTTRITYGDGLLPEGCVEGAAVLCDDGHVRVFGAVHGDSGGAESTSVYDDLGMLTLKKRDITAADIGKLLTGDEAFDISSDYAITCSDLLDAAWNPTLSAFTLNSQRQAGRISRVFSLNGGSAGAGSANLDGTPLFRGVRSLDVVSFRGALWLLMACQDDATPGYTLVLARTGNWCEHFELPGENAAAARLLLGRTYERGWWPACLASSTGWTRTGTAGNFSLVASGTSQLNGLKIDNADAAISQYGVETTTPGGTTLGGTAGAYPAMLRLALTPVSGGGNNDQIRCNVRLADGATLCSSLAIRFDPAGGIYVVDTTGPTTIASATGMDLSGGCEVIVYWSAWNTLKAVLYRTLAANPDSDGAWTSLYAGTAALGSTGSGDGILWGNATTTPSVAYWRTVAFNRAATGLSSRAALQINDYTDATYPELTDDPLSTFYAHTPGYDDGVRHGSRAPVATALPPAHVKSLVSARFVGAGGRADPAGALTTTGTQDWWRLTTSYRYDVARVFKTPCRPNFWRSTGDAAYSVIKLDAGASDERFRPSHIALFGCNAVVGKVQLNETDSWGTPSIDVAFGCASEAVKRYEFQVASAFAVEGADNRVVRLTSGALAPNQFKSNARVSWYVYSAALNRTRKILGNDGARIFVDGSLSGAGAGAISIFPDTLAFSLGTLTAAGYRYMRIVLGDTAAPESLAEGYQKLGYVVSGQAFALTDADWGHNWNVAASVAEQRMRSGYSHVKAQGPGLGRWAYGFDFLGDYADRANLTAAPATDADSFRRTLALLEGALWGETICALLPEIEDHLSASTFGSRALEVYPVRVRGPFDSKHVCHEYLTNAGIWRDRRAVAPILCEEVL